MGTNSEKNVDFTLPAILFGFALLGLIGHFTTYNFISKFVGKNSILIFLVNGIIGEGLLLSFLYLQKYSKNNPQKNGLGTIFKGINFLTKIIEHLFKILGYILNRLALVLGVWIFVTALISGASKETGNVSMNSMLIAAIIVIAFFVFRYFTNDDHTTMW